MDSERRRFLRGMGMAGTIVIAGCSSDSDDDGDSGNGDSDDGGGGDADIDASNEEFNHFEFEEGERYEYEVFVEDEGEGSFLWEVKEVSGNQMTVRSVYDVGETYYETTVTGDKSTIQGQLMVTPAGSFLGVALFSPTWGHYQQGNLEVGNRWEVSNPEGSVVLEIVGKDVYAGVEGFTSELHENDELVHESCVNPQLGMGIYSAFHNDDGSLQLEMELIDYSPPD